MPPRLRRCPSRERGTAPELHAIEVVLDGQMRRHRALSREELGQGPVMPDGQVGQDVLEGDLASVGRMAGEGGDDLLGESPDRCGVVKREVQDTLPEPPGPSTYA